MCHMGKGNWQLAQVRAAPYRDPAWPPGQSVPYQVEIANMGVALIPVDDANLVREVGAQDLERLRQSSELLAGLARRAEFHKESQLVAATAAEEARRPDLAAVLRYHAESCHLRPGRYADGGAMDWDNQPDKFRRVLGAPSLDLPESGPTAELQEGAALPDLQAIGLLLHDACGITAWKQQGPAKWSLRANPSSGALQPLEVYVLGRVGEEVPSHWHYNPFWHSLELVAPLPARRWQGLAEQLPAGAIVVALTRVVWRNAWKYGDPGFRYTHHDVGHHIACFAYAAAAQSASVVLLDSMADGDLRELLRPDEPEEPVCLLAIFPSDAAAPEEEWWRRLSIGKGGDFWEGEAAERYRGAALETYYGRSEQEARPLIAAAHEACKRLVPPGPGYWTGGLPPMHLHPAWSSAGPLRPLIHARRSAVSYDPASAPPGGLSREAFDIMLERLLHQPAWFPWRPAVQPVFFVHRVEGLEPGLYLLCRGWGAEELQASLDPLGRFEWSPAEGASSDVPLVLLRRGDVREEAKLASCMQEIASDSAFAVVFLAEHLPALERLGPWFYPRVHWEACALGGALYLAAGAAGSGLQATGIGCFFAPWVHALLTVDAKEWADVYHFTVGWPQVDKRVDLSLPPYHHVERLRGRDRDAVSSRGF